MLIHGLTLAPTQKKIMDECIRRGQPPPEGIQNAPELNAGLALYYTAFLNLHGCRQLGTAMGPIDWITIDRYCERYGLEGEQYEDMHYYISHMDAAYMKYENDKADAERKKQEAQHKRTLNTKRGRRK